MATVTKPIALDESINTTENPSRNIADVLAEELSNIAQSIGAINQKYKIVQTLPDTDISTTAIYLVPKSTAQTDNTYDEYINLTGTSLGWEKIGDTEIDLSDYYTESEVDTLLSEKADISDIPVLPTADERTSTTGEFETVTGGLLNECEIELEPIQDLHGYSKPWVGGAGKNKAITKSSSFTSNNVTFTINSDGSIKLSGTADATANIAVTEPITVSAGITYTVSIGESGIGYGITGYGIGTYTITPTNDYSNACVQVRIVSGTTYNTTIYPMIELGSTATSYEPYSNICPISGHTQADVYVVGKNMIDSSATAWKQGIFVDGKNPIPNNYWCYQEEYYPIKGGFIYSIQATIINAGRINFYDKNYDFISTSQPMRGDSPRAKITAPLNANFFRIDFNLSGSTTAITPNDIATYKLQLELGSSATTFKPYKGKTYSTSLGSTYYGGTIDLVSGELTIDKGYASITSLTRNTDTSYWSSINNAKPNSFDLICDKETASTDSQSVGIFINASGAFRLNTRVSYSSATDCINAYGGSLNVVYELATPTTVQLTPQQIISLVGKNYVDAPLDGQSIVEVKFKQLMTIDDVLALIGG